MSTTVVTFSTCYNMKVKMLKVTFYIDPIKLERLGNVFVDL